MEIFHWSQLQGNRFRRSLNPKMLTSKGLVVIMKCSLIGEPKGIEHQQIRHVVFGKDYALALLQRKILAPLKGYFSIEEIVQIMKEAEMYDSIE